MLHTTSLIEFSQSYKVAFIIINSISSLKKTKVQGGLSDLRKFS